MEMVYPCLEADLSKLIHNVKEIVSICDEKNIKVTAVTKVFCAYRPIVESILKGGVSELADSRILNLKKIKDLNCKKTLLRIPMVSECYEVIKYSDMSLNSEIDTIKKLSKAAIELNKVHDILLMVDIGDLREGVLVEDVVDTVRQIISLDNIKFKDLREGAKIGTSSRRRAAQLKLLRPDLDIVPIRGNVQPSIEKIKK